MTGTGRRRQDAGVFCGEVDVAPQLEKEHPFDFEGNHFNVEPPSVFCGCWLRPSCHPVEFTFLAEYAEMDL
jgi:hypothetical protein